METMEGKLVGNGLLLRAAHLNGKSIHGNAGIEARIILRVRAEATAAGYTRRDINRKEMEGERGEYGLRPQPYEAIFRGYEVLPNGVRLRSYNVAGDHRLSGSTLGIVDLVHARITPYDITAIQLVYEYLKEIAVIAWAQIQMKIWR